MKITAIILTVVCYIILIIDNYRLRSYKDEITQIAVKSMSQAIIANDDYHNIKALYTKRDSIKNALIKSYKEKLKHCK